MGRNRTKRTVIVTCALCGLTRHVRPRLVQGFQILACASHHATVEKLGLQVAAGQVISVTPGVAGFFDGFSIAEPTPAMQRSLHRATAIAATAVGQPAPESTFDPADTSWIDQRLERALTERLGPDGWEIADWDRTGRFYQVKMYTDWGWAGFVEGTLGQIASVLAEACEETRTVADATFRCARCRRQLDPFTDPTPCPCGTVAWRPQRWTTPFDTIRGVLAYEAPDPGMALDAAMLADFWDGCHEK
jgi:hypothetical protein